MSDFLTHMFIFAMIWPFIMPFFRWWYKEADEILRQISEIREKKNG